MTTEPIAQLAFPGTRFFQVALTNLIHETSDGIVNAANGQLAHGGGVALAIARAAGPELESQSREIVERQGPLPAGSAVMTTAGRLPFRGVIHAVGPRHGEGDEEGKLTSALMAAYWIADRLGWQSLSQPAVSSGIFAVPAETCVRAYVRAAREFWAHCPDSSLKLIRLCLVESGLVDAVVDAIKQVRELEKPI
jgi:O-acetyl-ADP-ribose deacetylase (regulator of RNase III)